MFLSLPGRTKVFIEMFMEMFVTQDLCFQTVTTKIEIHLKLTETTRIQSKSFTIYRKALETIHSHTET